MSDFPRLGVVVVHYGDPARTLRCIESFGRALRRLQVESVEPRLAELVVVDNTGNLPELVPFPGAKVHRPGRNLGYAGGVSAGVDLMPHCDAYVVSNNDILLAEDALLWLLRGILHLPSVGLLQPLLLTPNEDQVESAGITSNSIMHGFNYASWDLDFGPTIEVAPEDSDHTALAREVFGVDGALFAVSAGVWAAIGGWDPEFFMFDEDILLSWKARLAGYRNYLITPAVGYHERGGTAIGYQLKEDPVYSSYYTTRNAMLCISYVYRGPWLWVWLFAGLLFETMKNAYLALARREVDHLRHHFAAMSYLVNEAPRIRTARSKVVRKKAPSALLREGFPVPFLRSMALLMLALGGLQRNERIARLQLGEARRARPRP